METKWRGSLQLALGLALAVLFFFMLAPFMVPLFLAAVFAILCYPLFSRLKAHMPPWAAGITLTFGLLAGILGPLITLVIGGTHQLIGFLSRIKLPQEGDAPESLLSHPFLKNFFKAIENFMPSDKEWVKDQALNLIHTVLQKISALLAGTLSSVPTIALGAAIVVLSFYFFLVDGPKLLRFLENLSPMKHEKTEELFFTFQGSCRGVVLGLFASALAQGFLVFLFALFTGVPHALVWGIVTMVLSFVPLFGSTPIGVGLTLYLFSTGHPVAGFFMGLGAIIVGLSDNVIRPWVMKGESEMHPLLALVSVFGALNLFGAAGIFLGPIIAAVFVSFLRIVVLELKRENGTAINLPPGVIPG